MQESESNGSGLRRQFWAPRPLSCHSCRAKVPLCGTFVRHAWHERGRGAQNCRLKPEPRDTVSPGMPGLWRKYVKAYAVIWKDMWENQEPQGWAPQPRERRGVGTHWGGKGTNYEQKGIHKQLRYGAARRGHQRAPGAGQAWVPQKHIQYALVHKPPPPPSPPPPPHKVLGCAPPRPPAAR
jgi:hypothetical protein